MSEAILQLARLIEGLAAVVVGYALVSGTVRLLGGRLSNAALTDSRRQVASLAVSALGLVTAATLLKTVALRGWNAIGLFAAVLALRTLLKYSLSREERSAEARQGG